jgi:MFS family permease
MPFLLHKAGVPVATIATVGAMALLPSAYKIFWAPVLDLGIRRRTWLMLAAGVSAVCFTSSLLLQLPQQLTLFEILLVAGNVMAGLVASCNGGLVCTTVDPAKRGQAAGFVNAANLGGAALGGGLVLTLANTVSLQAAAIALAGTIALPAFAALAIEELPAKRDALLPHLRAMASEIWKVVRSRPGWTSLVLCISPVGTVALTNLFSALGADYHASGQTVELVNGYAGGFVTATGALASGYILDRIDRRKMYLLSGLLTAACCILMSLAPHTPLTYTVGCLSYLLIAGLAYASFSAVAYEAIGVAGKSAATLYTIFPAAGNQAIAYTLFLDGRMHESGGINGCLWTDASLNVGGVLALLVVFNFLYRRKSDRTVFSHLPPSQMRARRRLVSKQ